MATIGSFTLPTPEVEKVDLFQLVKTDLSITDNSLLETITGHGNGDIAVIQTTIDEVDYNRSSYIYDDLTVAWVALNGNVEADKVIMTSDIVMAGNYTQVGNLTKTTTGTAVFSTKGMSVASALTEIFSKRLQPTITSNPAVGAITVNGGTTSVEAGTFLATVNVTGGALSAGAYTYGPATGITTQSTTLTRVANGYDNVVVSTATGTYSDPVAITIGDQGGNDTTTNLAYIRACTHNAGATAVDNLGSDSSPIIAIAAGTKSRTSGSVTCFRKHFRGAATSTFDITSDSVRGLTNSTAAASANTTFTITIPEGARQVTFAYNASLREVSKVADEVAFGTDITGSFELVTMPIEGANGYAPIDYKVYTYRPATALGSNTYTVTI